MFWELDVSYVLAEPYTSPAEHASPVEISNITKFLVLPIYKCDEIMCDSGEGTYFVKRDWAGSFKGITHS